MMKIEWGAGSGFNLGRLVGTTIRIERYNIGSKGDPQWRFLISDEHLTYMHVDDRTFSTIGEMEDAAIDWLVAAGRLNYLH